MGSIDRASPPEIEASRPGPPELEPVGRRNGFRPAIAAVVVVALLLAVAVWKPWEAGGGAATARSTIPPGVAGGLLPAITARPDASDVPAPTPTPTEATFAGLDLSIMGVRDPHDAWGVGVAYVSQIQLDNARFGGAPYVTPVVSWEVIEPRHGHTVEGPVLDHQAVTSIAVAVTWPSDIMPVAVHLVTFGPLRPARSGAASPRPASEILLTASLDELMSGLRDVPQIGAVRSGAFFLSSPMPGNPTTWVGRGWPPADYAFLVDLGGGAQVSLPFVIAAAPAG